MVDIYSAEFDVSFGRQRLVFIGGLLGNMGYGLFTCQENHYHLANKEGLPILIEDIKFNMQRNNITAQKTIDDEMVKPVIEEIEKLENGMSYSERLTAEVNFLLGRIGLNELLN